MILREIVFDNYYMPLVEIKCFNSLIGNKPCSEAYKKLTILQETY